MTVGLFYWDATATAADNDGTVVAGSIASVIDGCFFAGGGSERERILVTGISGLVVRDCTVFLDPGVSTQVFVAANGGGNAAVHLWNNYLSAGTGEQYVDRLFSVSGQQPVSYSIYVGSGGVIGDTEGEWHFAGRVYADNIT